MTRPKRPTKAEMRATLDAFVLTADDVDELPALDATEAAESGGQAPKALRSVGNRDADEPTG